jgi:hypothetical protein
VLPAHTAGQSLVRRTSSDLLQALAVPEESGSANGSARGSAVTTPAGVKAGTPWVFNPATRRLEPEGHEWNTRTLKWEPVPAPPARQEVRNVTGGSSDEPLLQTPQEGPEGPSRGPRKCPARSRRKRIGHGPKATLPTRNGMPLPKPQRVKWSFPKSASGWSCEKHD